MSRPLPEPRAGRLLATILLVAVAPAAAQASDADRDLPAQIEADRFELDNQKEVSIYEGNVSFVQGSTRVRGDRITLRTRDGEVRHLLIEGDPASYEEISNAGEPIEARGLQIEFDADDNLLRLEGQASLSRPGETFSGERIRYDTGTEVVTAHRAEDGSGERVRIVIQPSRSEAGSN